MKVVINALFIALLIYFAVAVIFYVFQRNFMYFPTKAYPHPYGRIGVVSQGETIETIVLNSGNRKALLYFGGNGEAVVANADKFSAYFPDMTIYLVNSRGYGGSSGVPTEAGIYADALAVYDKIAGDHARIYAAGRSLGSGVATYVAANRTIAGTALITPFDSILNLAKATLPIFPVSLLLKDHYDSMSRVKSIESNILVIAAEFDKIVPAGHTQRLVGAFRKDQVVLKIIKNVGHNTLSNSEDYYTSLRDFL